MLLRDFSEAPHSEQKQLILRQEASPILRTVGANPFVKRQSTQLNDPPVKRLISRKLRLVGRPAPRSRWACSPSPVALAFSRLVTLACVSVYKSAASGAPLRMLDNACTLTSISKSLLRI